MGWWQEPCIVHIWVVGVKGGGGGGLVKTGGEVVGRVKTVGA